MVLIQQTVASGSVIDKEVVVAVCVKNIVIQSFTSWSKQELR